MPHPHSAKMRQRGGLVQPPGRELRRDGDGPRRRGRGARVRGLAQGRRAGRTARRQCRAARSRGAGSGCVSLQPSRDFSPLPRSPSSRRWRAARPQPPTSSGRWTGACRSTTRASRSFSASRATTPRRASGRVCPVRSPMLGQGFPTGPYLTAPTHHRAAPRPRLGSSSSCVGGFRRTEEATQAGCSRRGRRRGGGRGIGQQQQQQRW